MLCWAVSDTFDAVLKWKHDIDNKVFLPSGERIPVLLLGNKSDLLDEGHTPCIPTADLDNFLAHNSFYAHYLCSAKTGHNVKEACTHLVARIHHNNQAPDDGTRRRRRGLGQCRRQQQRRWWAVQQQHNQAERGGEPARAQSRLLLRRCVLSAVRIATIV